MFDINKEELLKLNEVMKKTITEMNYDNPMEVSAFASTMVSIGNQINIKLIKTITDKKEGNDES